MMKRLRYALLLPVLLFWGLVQASAEIPPLTARVTDQTGTLDATQRDTLEQKLAAFEARKGAQIAVLIVATTAPETIEQYSIRVVDRWKLGRARVDDGLLLIVARDDRTLRIEVGYGLEGVVPDAVAHRVIDEIIVPQFRAGDYYGGIDAGVTQLIALVDGEPLPPPAATQTTMSDGDRLDVLMPLLFFGLFAAQGLRRLLGPAIGALTAGSVIFGLAWLLSGAVLMALVFGLVAAVLTLFGVHPGMGGGVSSRGGGGGGGFGGGGGGFGGGGASGRW